MSERHQLVLVEDFLLAISCGDNDQPEVVQTTVKIDLEEFKLTEEEADKLKKIIKKLNCHLSDAFSQVCSAASVISDIYLKEPISNTSITEKSSNLLSIHN